ncbi:ABC transporter ATP-binding protein [Halobellus sp. EA9]|uniref:ABC transporter ATP-binding protein n=1 Tax=Halobellus sp. EA9 TaxID=3421647 RepID=UPI003EC0245D
MLELTDLTKRYDGFAFGPLDLTVEDDVLAVLGPSGSGKTTLLSLIAGIVEPDGGTLELRGRSLVGTPLESRRTGLVFQDGALFPHMTARENVRYAAADSERIDELAERLEISGILHRKPGQLSGGERQRVALARTLAADPDVLLLDEPLSSLDAPIRRRLRSELHALFESLSIPVVYVTHDQRTATALGDRMAIFRDGRIEQIGDAERVLCEPANEFVARFTGTENVFDAVGDGRSIRVGDRTLDVDESVPEGASVTACVHPSRIGLASPDDRTDDEATTLPGTVDHWLNEGGEYRVVVDVEGVPAPIVAAVQPPVFEALRAADGSAVRVVIPRSSVHLIR